MKLSLICNIYNFLDTEFTHFSKTIDLPLVLLG